MLADARLVTTGEGTVEVAHEALIRDWPTFREWLDEDREGRLSTAGYRGRQEWDALGRDPGALFRGARFATRPSGQVQRPQLNEHERAVRDPRPAEAERVARRPSAATAAPRARRSPRGLPRHGASRSVSRSCSAGRAALGYCRASWPARRSVAGGRGKTSGLGAPARARGGRLDDSIDTRGALLGALEDGSRIRTWLQGFASPVIATSFSPDGKLLATLTFTEATLWDTTSWGPTGPRCGRRRAAGRAADFSPDGRTLAVAGGEGRVELWDVAARKKLRELTDPSRRHP